MSDMTLVLRIRADGAAEVVGVAKQVAAATAGIGTAGAEAGREVQGLANAIRVTEAEIASHSDTVRQAAAAQAQLAQVVERTRTPVERLTADLRQLEGLRPFARTGEEAVALERSLARTRAALAQATREQDGLAQSSGLAGHQITNLQYQLSDVAAQLGSGANPFMIMMQQGPQVVDALGGITSAAGLVTVGVLALGAVTVAPFAMLTARAMAADTHIRAVAVALEATGRSSQAMAADIQALTDRTAQSPFYNREQAEQAIQGLARIRQVSAALREQVLALAPALATALGKDAVTAALDLGDAFARPTEGAKRLDDALNFLSAAQLESIERFDRQGNRTAAQQALYDALLSRLRDLAEQGITPTSRAAKELGDAWDGLMASIAKSEPIQEAVRVMTRLLNAMRDVVAWDAPVARRLTFAESRLKDESGTLARWEKDGLTTGDRWQEGAFLKSDVAIIDAQRQKVAKLKAEVEALRKDYDQVQQSLRSPGSPNGSAGGTASAPSVPTQAPPANEGVKQGLAAARELLQVEEQRLELLDRERLLQNAFNVSKDAGERRQLGRAITEVRAAYAALLTPQERALKASGDELRIAQAGRLERVRLAATIQAETEATDQRLVGKDRERYVTDKVDAAVRMASEGYTENVRVMDATARGALTLVDAYAAGEAAALRQAAANEAGVQALTTYGVSVEELTQKLLEQRATEAAVTFAGQTLQYQRQVEGLRAVAAAQREGVAAVQDAQREQKLLEATATLRAKAEATGNADIARAVDALIDRYRGLTKEEQDAQRAAALNEMIRLQREGMEISQVELRLVGQTEEQRRLELARLRAINELKAKGIDLEKETNAERRAGAKTYVDEAVARERINIQLDREREKAAERVRIATKATDDVVQYFAQATDDMLAGAGKGWRGLWDSVVGMARRTFATIIAEAALRPIVAPVIFSALGAAMPASAATPQGMAGSFEGQGGGGLINMAASKAGGWAMDKLGLSGGWDQLMATNLFAPAGSWAAAAPAAVTSATAVPISGTVSANAAAGIAAGGNSAVANTLYAGTASGVPGAGVTVGGVLGAAGAGAFGGMLGGYIGTASGSKAVGGFSGAALGAGSAYLASIMGISSLGGPVGLAIGAVVGAIMGALGTQKPSVGPTASSGINRSADGRSVTSGGYLTDNGGDPAVAKQLGDAIAATLNTALMGGGSIVRDLGIGRTEKRGLYVSGSLPYREFGDDVAGMYRYSLLESGTLQGGGPSTIKAIRNSQARTLEDAAKDIGLGAAIDAGTTALAELDKSVTGVEKAAKKATAASYEAAVAEKRRADGLGLGAEYAALVTAQFRQAMEPETLTPLRAALAALDGQFAALSDAVHAMGLSISDAEVATAKAAAAEKLLKAARDDYDTAMRGARGLGVVDQAIGIRGDWYAKSEDYKAAGRAPDELYTERMRALFASIGDLRVLNDAATALQSIDEAAAQIARGRANEVRASLSQDLDLRRLQAQAAIAQAGPDTAAAQAAQKAYELRSLEIAQAREMAGVTDEAYRADLLRTQELERQALASRQNTAAIAAQTAAQAQAVAAAGNVIADLDRERAGGSTGLTPQERIAAVDAMLRRDLALSRSVDPTVAEEALRRLVQTRQTAKDTYSAVYGAGSAETVAMTRRYEDAVRDLAPVKSWEQKVLEALVALPSEVSAKLDLKGRILEIYEPAVLQRIDPAVRVILERLATLAEQGYDFTALPADAQRNIAEVLSRLQAGGAVTALDFSRVPADARRELVEVLGRYASDLKVDEFEWSLLPADGRRMLAEIMGRYRNDVRVDQLDFADVPADTQRAVAEMLTRTLNGDRVSAWMPITLPADAARTVTETVKRDVSETVTSAAMREMSRGFETLQLQTASVMVNQLHALGLIVHNAGLNIVRAITGNWGWGAGLPVATAPHVLTTREADYLARYQDLADAWISNPAFNPGDHYTTAGWKEGRTFAVGGRVEGPGTDTSDDVAAWLSRDEFVVRAAAARAIGYDLLGALNSGNLTEAAHLLTVRARNDNVPRFAAGGRVGGAGGPRPTSAPAIMSVPAPWDGGAAAGVSRLTGQVERLTAEVVRIGRERAEDASRGRRLATEIATDQIDAIERQEQQLRAIVGKQRRVAI